MSNNLYCRNGNYYARVQINGRDVRRSLKTPFEPEAKRRLKVLLASVSARHGTVRKPFTDVIDATLADAEPSLTAKTMQRYIYSGVVLSRHFEGRYWDTIDKKAVLEFITERKADGVTVRTIKNDLSVLSVAAEYAIERDWAGTNPVTEIGKRALRYKPPVFVLPPDDDVELVLGCIAGPLEQLCRALRHTGMRRDEAVFLKWQDVDLTRRAVTLFQTKSGVARTISLNESAAELIDRRPRQPGNPYVFTRNDGEIYKGASLGFRQAKLKASGIRKYVAFRLHDLRHIFAIEYLRDNGNLYALQKQLGHGSIRQTEWYLQFLTPEEQEKAKSGPAQKPAHMHGFTLAKGGENG